MVQGWLQWKSVLLLNATPGDSDVILDNDVIIGKQEGGGGGGGGNSEELGQGDPGSSHQPALWSLNTYNKARKKCRRVQHRNNIKVSIA